MMVLRGFLCLLLLLSLGTVSVALTPDAIVITTDKPWVIAGGTDTSTITVHVVNNTANTTPVEGALVHVSVDPLMGTISPENKTIGNTTQDVSFIFKPKFKSGNATISVTVSNEGVTKYAYGLQPVDHTIPKYFTQITPPPVIDNEFPVGSNVTLTFRMMDQYGNWVDNKRSNPGYSESLRFLDSETFNGGFLNGTLLQKSYTSTPDANGNINTSYLLPTFANLNPIGVIAPVGVINNLTLRNDVIIYIRGVALDPKNGGDIISSVSATTVRANGEDTVNVIYTVLDRYNNPVPDYSFKWWSSIGEAVDLKTNSMGQAYIVYGRKSIPGSVTLYAGFLAGLDFRDAVTITFATTGPTDFILSGFPQIIPSLDVPPYNSSSMIRVKVIDGFGTPQEGESVTFAITNKSSYPSQMSEPYLSATTATSDADGYATVYLIPGAFPRPGGNTTPVYNITEHLYASGYATITATWNGHPKDLTVEYKNYPHLRIETKVSPENVSVGDEVEVTVSIIGDGYALKKPTDVMLLNDRSNSMLDGINSNNDPNDRMKDAMIAAQAFVGAMENGYDRVGTASFGDKTTNTTADLWSDNKLWIKTGEETGVSGKIKGIPVEVYHDTYIRANYPGNGTVTYSNYSTIDLPLTSYFQSNNCANLTIQNLVPYNSFINNYTEDGVHKPEKQYSASMRHGLYTTITYMKNETPTYTKARAIVGLIDTDFTWFGNPLAATGEMTTPFAATGGNSYWPFVNPNTGDYSGNWSRTNPTATYQNMSNYAKANNIKLFMIVYSSGSVNSEGIINTTCVSTGGQSFRAKNPEQLIEKFLEIARIIHRLAGVDTDMVLDFGNMNVDFNGTINATPGKDVFEYVFEDGVSTFVTKFETRPPHNLVQPPPAGEPSAYPYIIDQSNQWNDTVPHLHFNVGNISIDETWVGHFKLRAKTAGVIDLFGNNSYIRYSDTSGDIPVSMNLALPHTMVIVTEDPQQQNVTQNVIDIIDNSLNATPSESTELLNIDWLLNYTGNETVRQISYYQFSPDPEMWSGDWVQFDTNITGGHPLELEPYSSVLDVRDHAGWVRIKIYSYEEPLGGPSDDEIISNPIRIGAARTSSIRIT